MASSADRAVAGSGVAGLGSEPMATLRVEWLELLHERSESDESCFAKPAAFRGGPGALGDAFVSPSRPLGAFGWFGQAHDSTLRLVERAGRQVPALGAC